MGNEQSSPAVVVEEEEEEEEKKKKSSRKSILQRDRAIRSALNKPRPTFQLKVVLRGERGAGKSSLLARLRGEPIPPSHVKTPQLQSAFIHWSPGPQLLDHVQVQVWDVVDHGFQPQQEKTDGPQPHHTNTDRESSTESIQHSIGVVDAQSVNVYHEAHAAIFLMDITKWTSLEYVRCELENVPVHIPTLVLGTFRDCGNQRKIFKEDVQELLAGKKSKSRPHELHYFECSLLNCYGLKVLHQYLGIPFLHLKLATLRQQMKLVEANLAGIKTQIEMSISEQRYSDYVEYIRASNSDIRTGKLSQNRKKKGGKLPTNSSCVSSDQSSVQPVNKVSDKTSNDPSPGHLSDVPSKLEKLGEIDDQDENVGNVKAIIDATSSAQQRSPGTSPISSNVITPSVIQNQEKEIVEKEEVKEFPGTETLENLDEEGDLPARRNSRSASNVTTLKIHHSSSSQKVPDADCDDKVNECIPTSKSTEDSTHLGKTRAESMDKIAKKNCSDQPNSLNNPISTTTSRLDNLEDFKVKSELDNFYSSEESDEDDEDVVVDSNSYHASSRKKGFLYSSESESESDLNYKMSDKSIRDCRLEAKKEIFVEIKEKVNTEPNPHSTLKDESSKQTQETNLNIDTVKEVNSEKCLAENQNESLRDNYAIEEGKIEECTDEYQGNSLKDDIVGPVKVETNLNSDTIKEENSEKCLAKNQNDNLRDNYAIKEGKIVECTDEYQGNDLKDDIVEPVNDERSLAVSQKFFVNSAVVEEGNIEKYLTEAQDENLESHIVKDKNNMNYTVECHETGLTDDVVDKGNEKCLVESQVDMKVATDEGDIDCPIGSSNAKIENVETQDKKVRDGLDIQERQQLLEGRKTIFDEEIDQDSKDTQESENSSNILENRNCNVKTDYKKLSNGNICLATIDSIDVALPENQVEVEKETLSVKVVNAISNKSKDAEVLQDNVNCSGGELVRTQKCNDQADFTNVDGKCYLLDETADSKLKVDDIHDIETMDEIAVNNDDDENLYFIPNTNQNDLDSFFSDDSDATSAGRISLNSSKNNNGGSSSNSSPIKTYSRKKRVIYTPNEDILKNEKETQPEKVELSSSVLAAIEAAKSLALDMENKITDQDFKHQKRVKKEKKVKKHKKHKKKKNLDV